MKNIHGLYPAPVTPYTEDGAVNFEALELLIKRNLNEGASGFFVAGSSAECFLLTESERISIFEAVCAYKKETVIIAHVGAVGTDESIRYAKAAKTFGAHYISATLPFYYNFSDAQIVDYFYDIAKASDMQVLIYNFPSFTNKKLNLDNPDIRGLLNSNAVCGIKHTDQNLVLIERIRDINPDLAIMNGYDDTMTAGLALGADGSVGSTFNVMLPHYIKIYNEYKTGKKDIALTLQTKANNIMDAFVNIGLISGIKYILTTQGIDVGVPRRPFKPLTTGQMKYITDVLKSNEV